MTRDSLPAPLAGITWTIDPAGDGQPITLRALASEIEVAQTRLTFDHHDGLPPRAFVEGGVEVGWEGRGLGTAMLAWAEATARTRFADAIAAGEGVMFRVDAESAPPQAVELFADNGLPLAVAEEEMELDLAAIPEPLEPPAGFTFEPWSDATAGAFFEVYDDAFRTRPGFPGWDLDRWRATYTGSDDFRPELSPLLRKGDEPVAYAVCWVEREAGYIVQMGVRQAFRRQHLGEAVLLRCLGQFRETGLKSAKLDVATNNPEARALYLRLGFEVIHRYESYRKTLAVGR